MDVFFKIGDKVKFLNETGGGIVRDIVDPDMVMVETEDGFEIPFMTSELLHTTTDHSAAIETEPVTVKEEVPVVEDKMKPEKQKKLKEENQWSGDEVDLHIEEIVKNPEVFSDSEIVEMQLSRFEISLEGAIRARQKRIIFIHGRGSGKLKHRIQKILDEKYPRCKYQDASFKKYGYGATLILIRR